MVETKEKTKKIIIIFLLIFWMSFIFYQSSQNGASTSSKTAQILTSIEKFVNDLWKGDAPEGIKYFFETQAKVLISIMAHFFEYFVLSILACLLIKEKRIKTFLIVVIFCTLYGITDEIHQIFVPGRVFDIKDILTDSSGAILGSGICYFIKKGISK